MATPGMSYSGTYAISKAFRFCGFTGENFFGLDLISFYLVCAICVNVREFLREKERLYRVTSAWLRQWSVRPICTLGSLFTINQDQGFTS